jgi:hypothetical protein
MKAAHARFVLAAIALVLLHLPRTWAADEVFDRRQEVQSYLRVFQLGNPSEIVSAAKALIAAGISDAQLASVLGHLVDDAARGARVEHGLMPRMDVNYGSALVQALASLGIEESEAPLKRIAQAPDDGGSWIRKVRSHAEHAAARIPWYRARNNIMASKRNHHDGDNPRTSMLINLLESEDRSYRDYALDTITRERLRDPRLFAFLDRQVEVYLTNVAAAPVTKADPLIESSVKLLGFSGDRARKETLERVLASKLPASIKAEAKLALNRLK